MATFNVRRPTSVVPHGWPGRVKNQLGCHQTPTCPRERLRASKNALTDAPSCVCAGGCGPLGAKLRVRADATDDANVGEPLRQPPGTDGGVRATTGDAQHREPFQPERVGQVADVVGPVDQRASGLEVRQAHAWPVGRDHPDASVLGRLVAKPSLSPRPGKAVAVDQRLAAGVAPLGVIQQAAVWQPDRLATAVLHGQECTALTTGCSSNRSTGAKSRLSPVAIREGAAPAGALVCEQVFDSTSSSQPRRSQQGLTWPTQERRNRECPERRSAA
jgi:hypothetical protein